MAAARRRRWPAGDSGRVSESAEPTATPQVPSPLPARPRPPQRALLAIASLLFGGWFLVLLLLSLRLR